MAPKSLAQKLASNKTKKTDAPPPYATAAILFSAFVTAPGPKARQQEAQTKTVKASKIYLLSFSDRKLLAKGPKVTIIDSEGNFVIDMPVPLFRATSTKKEMVTGTLGSVTNMIKLPENLEVQPVKEMIQHFNNLTIWNKFAKDLPSYKSAYWDIQLISAADFLGMTIYSQHIFNWYWARLRSGYLPEYADIDAVSAVQTALGDKFFRKVVNAMARIEHEGQIPDPEAYEAYLKTNERFAVAVKEAREKMQKHQAYVNRKNRREEEARLQAEADKLLYEQHQKQSKEKAANQQAKWDAQKKKDAELAARVKVKMAEPGKKTWKPDEAGYLRRVRGINVPT